MIFLACEIKNCWPNESRVCLNWNKKCDTDQSWYDSWQWILWDQLCFGMTSWYVKVEAVDVDTVEQLFYLSLFAVTFWCQFSFTRQSRCRRSYPRGSIYPWWSWSFQRELKSNDLIIISVSGWSCPYKICCKENGKINDGLFVHIQICIYKKPEWERNRKKASNICAVH